ncbi:MAG: peroxiredoxin [Candidatus Micrarchaeaceae archaeon]
MPSIGENAPEINAKAYFPEEKDIKEFHLGAYKGKWVILTFYPGDFTFVCATDVEAFTNSYEDFKKNGAEIFAVSTDSIFSHKKWAETSPRVMESKIPLIEDFTKRITSQFGFLNESTGQARRGTVIIDPEGKIQYISMHNDGLGKDPEHIYTAFMGLKYIHDTPAEKGHMCAIPAAWRPGKEALNIDLVKDIGKL